MGKAIMLNPPSGGADCKMGSFVVPGQDGEVINNVSIQVYEPDDSYTYLLIIGDGYYPANTEIFTTTANEMILAYTNFTGVMWIRRNTANISPTINYAYKADDTRWSFTKENGTITISSNDNRFAFVAGKRYTWFIW